MIFIVVKFPVRPECSDDWMSVVADFTAGTRAEPGNVFFEWSRSVEDTHEFVLVEGFRDAAAGEAHVATAHFAEAMRTLPSALAATPRIVNVDVAGDGWSQMAELQPR